MSDSVDLAPWAHPDAQRWFQETLRRSGFLDDLEHFMSQPAEKISLSHCRMVLMFVILLGRPGIWPRGFEGILDLVEERASEILALIQQGAAKSGLTIAEHRRQQAILNEIQTELEIVRRRVGKSRLTRKIEQPSTWNDFWR